MLGLKRLRSIEEICLMILRQEAEVVGLKRLRCIEGSCLIEEGSLSG